MGGSRKTERDVDRVARQITGADLIVDEARRQRCIEAIETWRLSARMIWRGPCAHGTPRTAKNKSDRVRENTAAQPIGSRRRRNYRLPQLRKLSTLAKAG